MSSHLATSRIHRNAAPPAAIFVAVLVALLGIGFIVMVSSATSSPRPSMPVAVESPKPPIEPALPSPTREKPKPAPVDKDPRPAVDPLPEPSPETPLPPPKPPVEPPIAPAPIKKVDPPAARELPAVSFPSPSAESLASLRNLIRGRDATPVARSLFAVVHALVHREWPPVPEDQSLLARYAEKFLKPACDDEEAALFLLEGIGRARKDAPSLRMPACRMMALGHLQSLPEAKAGPLMTRFAPELELSGAFTAEGRAIESLRDKSAVDAFDRQIDATDSIRDPGFKIGRGLLAVLKALHAKPEEQPAAIATALDALSKGQPASSEMKSCWAAFKSMLSSAKPCSRCKGTHEVPCDYGCDAKGEITKRCPTCNGSGKMPFSTSRAPCPEKRTGPHIWTEKCSKCGGTHKLPCRSCKAPWQPLAPALVAATPCPLCSGGGFLHSELKTLCPECFGLGQILAPAK